jgi:tape measure domain-containing protein
MADSTRRVSVRLSLDDAARVKQELREVGETGQRSLERIQGGADRASRALDLLDVAVRGVQIAGLAAGLRAVVVAGDQLTQSLARLQNATGSVERASEVYEKLYRDALQTGVAVKESVDAFQRFSIAAREIGATSDQVATLVGGLQRVGIVSGASTQEISATTQQLAQALASGVLQGDELRSILENMPLLAEALAKELGVGIGELRKLGAEGKLTADRVFPALLRATERIGAELEKAPLSLSRAFGQLQVATEGFLGQLDKAIGLSNTLARSLSGAARVLDGVRRGAGLLTESETLVDKRRQAAEIGVQIAALEAGIDTTRNNGTLRPRLTEEDRQRRLAELRDQYREINDEIAKQERDGAQRARQEQDVAAQRGADARRQRATADVAELRSEIDIRYRIQQEYEGRVTRLREAEAAGSISAAERMRYETLALRVRDEAIQRLTPKIEANRRAQTDAARAARDAEKEVNDVIRERERLIEQNETAYERYQRRIERLSELVVRSERIGQPVPNTTIEREAVSAMDELEKAQKRVQEGAERTSDTVRELGLTFSSAFEDAVIKGDKLSKVMQGLLQDIARVIARRTITEPLGAAASAGIKSIGADTWLTSLGSSIGGLFRAEGGPVAGGQPYIVGERGPEWFVPRSGGTVLPNGMSPDAGPVINNTISIDARGADAGVEARLRLMAGQIARQASAMTLDSIRRGGSAYETVRG